MQLSHLSICLFLQFFTFTDPSPIDISDQCTFSDQTILSKCYWRGAWSFQDSELIFKDEENFQTYGSQIKKKDAKCQEEFLPAIDFSKYSLLSKRTKGGGCSDHYRRRVYNDPSRKVILYEVIVEYVGTCEKLCGNFNWVVVPKIPEDYTVEFVVKEVYTSRTGATNKIEIDSLTNISSDLKTKIDSLQLKLNQVNKELQGLGKKQKK